MTSTLLLAITLAASPLSQARERPQPSQAKPVASDTAALARGWQALAAGRTREAISAAESILTRMPWNHEALALKIRAQAGVEVLQALDTYESWLRNGTSEDIGLLTAVVEGVLQQLTSADDGEIQRRAKDQLAALHGERTPPTGKESRYTADAEAAKAGDETALQRLQKAAQAPGSPDGAAIAEALGDAGPRGVPVLVLLLQSPAGPTRAAAASSLGRQGAREAQPALRKAMTDEDPFVRASAAVALARIGDEQGQQAVAQMLESPVADLRLMAAEAWNGADGPWVSAIMPLLNDPNGLTRIHTARLISKVNPEAANRTLAELAKDPNPVIRAESAKAMAEAGESDAPAPAVPELRRLLRDSDGWIRLRAASALAAAARGGR